MTVNATTIFSTTSNTLSVLAQAASDAAEATTNNDVKLVTSQIQAQLAAKVAALEVAPDPAVSNATQQQITSLNQQITTLTSTGNAYSGNSTVLAEISTQLAAMQTAAQSGDAAGFDQALQIAGAEIGNLNIVTPTAPFQADMIASLAGNGLGIGDSASYDLSTPAGQSAAEAAVNAAQTLLQRISVITTNNQILATSLANALTAQMNGLQAQQQQANQANSTQVQNEIQTLTQRAQDQEHVIQLALGNTQLLATALTTIETPTTATTPFTILQSVVGATTTATTAEQNAAAGLVNLLA